MCGIVGLIGDTTSLASRNMFRMMLFFDTIRGKDSTGVYRIGSDGESQTFKDAVTAERFLDYKTTDKLLTMDAGVTALIGHNRAATVGEVNASNAHPFKVDNITMVHNGTLVNEYELPCYRLYDVDSEMFTAEIADSGIDTTISKVDGAYAIVYHDREDNTLNILRNSERPLHYAVVKPKTYNSAVNPKMTIAIASEAWMITVSAHKCGLEVIGEVQEFSEMEHHQVQLEYIHSLKSTDQKDVFETKTLVEYKLPKTKYSGYSGYSSHNGRYTSHSTGVQKSKKDVNVSPVNQSTDRGYWFQPLSQYQDPESGLYYVTGVDTSTNRIKCVISLETYLMLEDNEISYITAGYVGDYYTSKSYVGNNAGKTIICSEFKAGFYITKKP
jgi:glucosamine 6-phosphate synthetase-like amidotransferase/phosphosugar isomerase protein